VALFVGKLIPRKRPQDLIQALAAGARDVVAVLVGAGPMEAALRRQAAALGVADRVRFAGLVPYDRLPDAYAAADVVAVTSSHEPWGLVVGEAMACGRPVVASDRVGAAGDLIEPGITGFTYPCGDAAGLAHLLQRVQVDAAAREQLGAAARRRMSHWGPGANATALALAVERAVALRKPAA
jgi:glycosyltransferase involved in cell wall biosynthesis